jgi:iron complex transport system ATP-binding protein
VAEGLSVGYPGREVLRGIDARVAPGETLAIVGPNGSGKTTLLRALSGDLRPWSGSVRAGGRELSSLRVRARARVVARVPQSEESAWPIPVRDYVAAALFASTGWFGAPGAHGRRAVDRALERMDLRAFAARPVTELSGGEFRRVLIARALAQGAGTLLLDEPASDLDLAWQAETLGVLRSLARGGMAVAFTVHDLNLASLAADRVLLVAGGRAIACGPPSEVIRANLIERAYGARVLVGGHPLTGGPHVLHAPAWLSNGGEDG